MNTSIYIGSLQEGAEAIAWRIQHLHPGVAVSVWLDDHGVVYAAPSPPNAQHAKLVGHYDKDRSARWIEQEAARQA